MEALTLTLFASVVLALSAVLFFAWNVKNRNHEHLEHLSLLPLDDESPASGASHDAPASEKGTL